MSKDAYWFKHDANAAFDSKLLRIRAIFGWEGYGVYFGIIEILRQQSTFSYEKSDSEMQLLATLLGIEFTRFKNIFTECVKVGLFKTNETHFYSNSLNNRMKEWVKQKKNGNKPKRSQTGSQNEANLKPKAQPNGSIRGEEIREEYINVPFAKFWDLYDKKVEREKVEKKWKKLTDAEREAIMLYIPKYKLAQPNKQYRKNPDTFLNNKSWQDELIDTTEANGDEVLLPKPTTPESRQRAAEEYRKIFPNV